MKNSTVIDDWLNRIEDDPGTRKILINMGKQSLDLLVESLPYATKTQHWHILNIISHIGDPSVATDVEKLLESPYPVIQIATIQCLEKLANKNSTHALMSLLLNKRNENLHIWIIHALGKLQAIESVSHLLHILETTDSTVVQYTVIEALQSIGDPIAIQTIVKYRNSENHHVRNYTENALSHFSSLGYC